MSVALFTPPTLEEISKLLPAFEVTELFASNARGAVYFANQRSLDRVVAIKLQSADADEVRQDAMDAFVKAVAGLKHPNLVSIFDSGRVAGMSYYILEFVPGKSLARSTKGKSVEFGQAMSIMKGICDGLSHAHNQGIFHGNLNPSNILLNQKIEPKIMNFGTRPCDGDSEMLRFVAPEVDFSSSGSVRSDVYSLGVIFYELITGVECRGVSEPASSFCGCKKAVDDVLKKAMSASPEQRMDSVSHFYEELERAANGTGAVALNGRKRISSQAHKPAAPVTSSYGKASKKQDQEAGNLVLKVVVIVILAIAVHQTWKYVDEAKTERAVENKRLLERQAEERERQKLMNKRLLERQGQERERQKAIAEANRIILEQQKRMTRPQTPVVEREKRVETAEESLERLQSALLLGNRAQMPVGCRLMGDSYYLFIADRMSWYEAACYAESYGGHLVTDIKEIENLRQELAGGREFWIGAGWSGTSWCFVDGGIMLLSPQGEGTYVLAASDGELVAADERKDAGFVIQWRNDGTNPGSLKAQLERTKASLGASPSFYPVGTVMAEGRRLLCLPGEMDWKEAAELAESGGGELAVVSDDAEAEAVEKLVSGLRDEQTVWLGGYLEGMHWKWVTGEPWRDVKWTDEGNARDEDVGLVIRADGGWAARERDEKESGLIIEWSKDRESLKVPDGRGEEVADAAEVLILKAKELLSGATSKRALANKENDEKFLWSLNGYLKLLNKSGQEEWEPLIDELKSCVGDEKVLNDEIRAKGINVARDMEKFVDYHGRKQAEIHAAYLADVEKIRQVFVGKIVSMRDTEKQKGQVKLVDYFDGILQQTGGLEEWFLSMDMILPKLVSRDPEDFEERDEEDGDKDGDKDKDGDDEEDG